MLFHPQFSTLRSDYYSQGRFEKDRMFSVILQQLNEYWLDRIMENGRWKSI